MKNITINVSKKYDVFLGDGIIASCDEIIGSVISPKKIAVITDDIVDTLYAEYVERILSSNFSVKKYVIKNGEASKNIDTLTSILEFLASNDFTREDALVSVGGGVVGDITGLSASLYMRGINFIQIPTTLLAMCDASVGGKTAVNLKYGKNLMGTFWQPSAVICDTEIVKNLPVDIFNEGMAEVIKCDIIRKCGIIDAVIEDKIKDNIEAVVEKCILLKKDIIEKDEFEKSGQRKFLNVGHTVAHAIEKLSDYKISHGSAVGMGLIIEAQMSKKLGYCDNKTVEKITKAVKKSNLYFDIPYNPKDMVCAMKKDKKNDNNLISFVLPKQIGECFEIKLSPEETENLISFVI